MARKIKKVVKVKKMRRCGSGGFFVGALLLGLAADFLYNSWPIGVIIGLAVGFILTAIAKSTCKA